MTTYPDKIDAILGYIEQLKSASDLDHQKYSKERQAFEAKFLEMQAQSNLERQESETRLHQLHTKFDLERQESETRLHHIHTKFDLERQEFQKERQESEARVTKLVSELTTRIVYLESEIAALKAENQELKARLTTIESRLDMLDKQMRHIAPLVRGLLEGSGSVLLDPEYQEIRNQEDKGSFSTTAQIITSSGLNISRYPGGLSGASKGVGRSLADFYRIVLGYSPRKFKTFRYWQSVENLVTEPHLSLAKSLV